ncbi:MAG: hypothetical protein HYX42_01625 [Polaromonas sp.]|uniref:S-4TM family putative pore-forming effector n=1 Tax=Polaromonas sp. TaxID=1869339 RepID=UPI0025FF2D28|nr:S-4TM family putative pore-forming effector [Polaromonas sp.]MBI2724927.1 hypothetical protein [Polaromonas sp.]
MNTINSRQNEQRELERLSAQRQLYATAKHVFGFQLILAIPIAIFTALIAVFLPEYKGHAALWGLSVAVLDTALLTPWQKRLRENAAAIQEIFDCYVLNLPWNELKVGKRPDPEKVHAQAKKYSKWASTMPSLKNWYSPTIDQLSLPLGRLVCQRANCWWDSQQRRRYATTLQVALGLVALIAAWVGFAAGLTIADFVLKIAAPLTPAFSLGLRQATEHRDAADRLDKLQTFSENLWSSALAGMAEDELGANSRNLQNEIYDGRKRNPLIFDTVFRWMRNEQELQMNYGSEELVEQAKAALAG